MYSVPVYKIRLVKNGNIELSKQIRSPKDVSDVIAALLADLDTEQMICVLLDTKNRVIGTQVIAHGGLNACYVRIADVFKTAILSKAHCIIVAHNHPSGETMPSAEEIKLTRDLIAAGKLLDIELLDHIIYADTITQRSLSLKEYYPTLWE
jgi:DNA repair protein RadC